MGDILDFIPNIEYSSQESFTSSHIFFLSLKYTVEMNMILAEDKKWSSPNKYHFIPMAIVYYHDTDEIGFYAEDVDSGIPDCESGG